MLKYDLVSGLVWMVVGLAFVFGGLHLGFGGASSPGPGFLPSIVGGVLFFLAGVMFVSRLMVVRKGEVKDKFWEVKGNWRKPFYSIFALIFYVITLEFLGYLLTTFVVTTYLVRFIGGRDWLRAILLALLGSSGSYIIFRIGLEVALPRGLIKIG